MKKRMKGTVVAVACVKHGLVKGDHCPMCREEVGEGPAVHMWKPMFFNDICETPIWVESKRQLKMECEKHGVRSWILPR